MTEHCILGLWLVGITAMPLGAIIGITLTCAYVRRIIKNSP